MRVATASAPKGKGPGPERQNVVHLPCIVTKRSKHAAQGQRSRMAPSGINHPPDASGRLSPASDDGWPLPPASRAPPHPPKHACAQAATRVAPKRIDSARRAGVVVDQVRARVTESASASCRAAASPARPERSGRHGAQPHMPVHLSLSPPLLAWRPENDREARDRAGSCTVSDTRQEGAVRPRARFRTAIQTVATPNASKINVTCDIEMGGFMILHGSEP
jgi:hypothetical protein